MTTPLPAIRLGGLDDLPVDAAPHGLPFTMHARFFFGSITLRASRPGIRFGELNNFSIDADPAKFAAMRECFFSGPITLIASHSGLRLGNFDDFAVNAAPPGRWRRSRRRAARYVNWRRSALRTCDTNRRLRRRIASICHRENKIETRQRRKIFNQRVRLHDPPQINSPRLRKFLRAGVNVQEVAGANLG